MKLSFNPDFTGPDRVFILQAVESKVLSEENAFSMLFKVED